MRSFAIIVLFFICSLAYAQPMTITIGVVPQQSPLKLLKVWQPIVDYLQKETGYQIVFKTEKSITEFEHVLYSGGYDLAYMNPYHYVIASKRQHYRALVRAKKSIVGILVSNQQQLDEVLAKKNITFLFPSPNAFAATMLTKYELKKKYGLNVDASSTVRYVNSHDSVYKGIARGIGDLGGGIERTYRSLSDPKSKEKLHIVYRTDAYPSHPIAYKPSLDKNTLDAIAKAFLDLPEELKKRLSVKEFIRIGDDEYDVIRSLADSIEPDRK